jgi:hypothetical protein
MAFVPPNGIFTIPRRGRAFRIDVDIAEELTDAYAYQMVRAIPSASTLLRSTDRFSPYNILRPKRALPDMSPFPDSFTRGHLRALNFSFIKWDE